MTRQLLTVDNRDTSYIVVFDGVYYFAYRQARETRELRGDPVSPLARCVATASELADLHEKLSRHPKYAKVAEALKQYLVAKARRKIEEERAEAAAAKKGQP